MPKHRSARSGRFPPARGAGASVPSPARTSAPGEGVGPETPRRALGLALALLTVAVLAAFSSGFGNTFVDWDDPDYVTENDLVQSPTRAGLPALLKTPVAFNYHPLTMLSLAADAALFGPGATSFIVTNTVLHLLNTLMVFALAYGLSRRDLWVATIAALIWGLHPMHVESVMWVSERKDVLYAFFFLLACLAYLRFRLTHERPWLVAVFGLFVLSCLSKAMAVVLPVVLLTIDYWQGRRLISRSTLLEKAPFLHGTTAIAA